jgi:TetR/AcrR family transcriptional regulator, mexJK operon transcriptional repressor
MNEMSSIARSGAGRPTKEQAEARHALLLETALDHFLDKGFEAATIEAIAASVNMTKRTVYARYRDKASLFRAAVGRATDRMIMSPADLAALQTGDLETTLVAVATARLRQVMTPAGLKLQRIIGLESYRFPELFVGASERAAKPVLDFLADQIQRHAAPGTAAAARPALAATAFMSQVLGGPVRMFVAGHPLDQTAIDDRVAFSVRLFLEGVRRA